MKTRRNFLFLLFLMLANSCQYFQPKEKNHTAYLDEVLLNANTRLRQNFASGSKYLDSSYNTILNPSKQDLFRRFKIYAECFLDQERDYIKAIKYADSGVNLFIDNKKKYENELAAAYNLKASVLLYNNNYSEAFKYLYDANQLLKNSSNYKQLVTININLGNVLYTQNKMPGALFYYKKAYQFSTKIKSTDYGESFVPITQALNNVAVVYEKLNKVDLAIATLKQLLNAIEVRERKHPTDVELLIGTKSVVYGNLGSNFLKQKKYVEAELYFKKSLSLSLANDAKYSEDPLYNMIKLGHVYLATKRTSLVIPILKSVKEGQRSVDYQFSEVNVRLNELIWKYYEKIGDIKKAYPAYITYDSIRDSIKLTKADLAKKDFNKEFVKLAQLQEIEVLKKKDELKTVYLLLAIGLTILSGLIIFLILKNSKATKQNVRKLTVLNEKISEHNEMMEKTLEALQQSQEDNTHMMQIVAHDMRTPIAGVIGLTGLMLAEDDLTEDQREILTMINTSGDDTLAFINDLLQSQQDKSKLIKEPVEIQMLLKYCVTLLESKAKEKKQELKITTIPGSLNINREKIWRVISNLISNAIKFSPNNSEIHISMDEKQASMVIRIKDEGIGIPPELGKRLFDMDPDVQREGTAGEKSFGLGLSISKQIVEAHNGSIWFESLPNAGTTFFVELPITEG